jgi:glycosyltransferase involved in cell wall biosynthesis
VIAASEDARDSLIAVGVRPERARWIPNPVSPWAERIERAPHDGGPLRILTVGRLEAIKGMDVIVEAVARLGATPFVWEIVGPGPDEEALRARAAALGIADRLRFLGRVPDLAPIVARAGLFVLASRVEGLSIAMLEAMAAGIPVIATRSGHGVEDALQGGAGVIVPVADPVALADAVAGLIADPERRRALSARGRERARQFSASTIAARYEQVLLEAVGER